MAEARVRFPWGLTIATALALALLLSLGVWQVQRLQWKAALIAEAEAAAARPPVDLTALRDEGGGLEFRKVALTCPGLATAPYVELQSIHDGQAGVRLISPCRPVGAEETVLVDRGFVAENISARPPVTPSDAPVALTAEVRHTPPPGPMAAVPTGRHFYARDNTAMAAALGVTGLVAAESFFAVESSNPEWRALQPSAPPAAFSNNHLGYAITWFGLALALVGFYIALLRRKLSLKQPRSASEALGKKESP